MSVGLVPLGHTPLCLRIVAVLETSHSDPGFLLVHTLGGSR